MGTLDEQQILYKSLLRFGSEMERVLGAPFVNLPASLERLLDALECEPPVSAYLNDCTDNHLPADFDARSEFERVAADETATFGPFPTDAQAASAEAYLILQELSHRRIKFHDRLFVGYATEPASPAERFDVFRNEVILMLTGNVEAHLAQLSQELGVKGPAPKASEEPETSVEPPVTIGFSEERLQTLLTEMNDAASSLDGEDREDALLQLEALRDELCGSHPKKSVVKVLLRVLKAIGGDARYVTALAQLKACLEAGELC